MKAFETKCYTSVDLEKAAAGGQDMLSPYHAMGNNPVSLVDPGGMQAFKDAATQNMMQFNPNAGMPSVTNGYYTPAINTSGWGWIGQWIQTVGNGEEALAEAFGQTARDNYDATTGNQNNNTSSVAGNYKNNGGNNGAASTGQGGGIPTMVNAEGETVAVNGSFNHEAELNPSATFMGTTSIEGSYYRSSYSSSNWSRYLQGASFIFSNSTAIPGAGVGFVTGTKAGKLLSLGGSYVWKSSSYSAQRELVREMAVGSDAIKSAGAVVGIVSIGITATNVIVNQQLNASNMLDVGVTALRLFLLSAGPLALAILQRI